MLAARFGEQIATAQAATEGGQAGHTDGLRGIGSGQHKRTSAELRAQTFQETCRHFRNMDHGITALRAS